jgi:DNA polymerase III epsilon subunit-like protein
MTVDHTAVDRVMIDIETLGRDPGAAVLSIGAVRFDLGGVGETFHRSISLESCQEAGLSIEAATLEWWLDQDDAAQTVLTGGEDLAEVLAAFKAWYGDADEVWANSPAFDCTILEAAGEAVGIEMPWAFYEERDFRTLKELPGAADVEQSGTDHDALADAVHQAEVASATLCDLSVVNK